MEPNPEGHSLAGALFNFNGTECGKNISIEKKYFCEVKYRQLNVKFNSKQFSLLNICPMSIGAELKVGSVFSWLKLKSELGNH